MIFETWILTIMVAASTEKGGAGGGIGNTSLLRMFRLLRLTRISRMARLLRHLPELLILIKGMFAASRSVCVTLFLLIVSVYVFAIIFRQMTMNTVLGDLYFPSVP